MSLDELESFLFRQSTESLVTGMASQIENAGVEGEAIREITERVITPEQVYEYLQALHSPAPTDTFLYTRALSIVDCLTNEVGITKSDIIPCFLGTYSLAVFLDQRALGCDHHDYLRKPIWFVAHGDQPTYLFERPTRPDAGVKTDIMPRCAHRPIKLGDEFPVFPAVVLRYSGQRYEVINEGEIGTREIERGGSIVLQPHYVTQEVPQDGFFPSDRIAYNPQLLFNQETRLVSGNMDNAAGVAACIAAINAFNEIAKEVYRIGPSWFNVGFVISEGEEGLPDDPAYFAQEARRFIHLTERTPSLVINVDGHDTEYPPSTALYGAYVSRCKGATVSPSLYCEFNGLVESLRRYGVELQQTEAIEQSSLSRSDCAAIMEKTYPISLGYGVCDPHHNRGLARVNMDGLVNLAKAITWIAVASGYA